MNEQDKAGLEYLTSMEHAGLLSSDEVFTELVSGPWWSAPVAGPVRHGKKRRR